VSCVADKKNVNFKILTSLHVRRRISENDFKEQDQGCMVDL
jgi:hypothetical protein